MSQISRTCNLTVHKILKHYWWFKLHQLSSFPLHCLTYLHNPSGMHSSLLHAAIKISYNKLHNHFQMSYRYINKLSGHNWFLELHYYLTQYFYCLSGVYVEYSSSRRKNNKLTILSVNFTEPFTTDNSLDCIIFQFQLAVLRSWYCFLKQNYKNH